MLRLFSWVAVLLLLFSLPAQAEIRVVAPGSLAGVMSQVVALWNDKSGGTPATISFGHSPEQARAIAMGEAPDVFIAADPEVMTGLQSRNLLSSDGILSLTSTRLILVGPATLAPGLPLDARLASQLGDKPLAMCDPVAVVSGRYSRDALTRTGAWEAVKNRVLIVGSPRAVIAAVERGEALLGLAYRADLAQAPNLRELAVFPSESVPPVVYPVTILAGHERPEVRAFIDFLRSSAVGNLFEKQGFAPGVGN